MYLYTIIPLRPISDQHQISPNQTTLLAMERKHTDQENKGNYHQR